MASESSMIDFRQWLISEKNFTMRSSKDVLSRTRRAMKMIRITSKSSRDKAVFELAQNDEFKAASTFIRSQLKRSVTLYLSFLQAT